MPVNKTKSPLAKKYGQKDVVRARNLLQTQMGLKPGSESAGKKIPWGVVGKIAQNEKKAGKTIKQKDIKKAKKRVESKGKAPFAKRYLKQEGKNVPRETSKEVKKKHGR